MNIINWCNDNQGFISAILTVISILISFVALFVSINANKLPFKKKLIIKTNYTYGIGENIMPFLGLEINAINNGNIPINLTYLGLGWYETLRLKKIFSSKRDLSDIGIIKSSEFIKQSFIKEELVEMLRQIKGNKTIYAIAFDSSGKLYKRKITSVKTLKKATERIY